MHSFKGEMHRFSASRCAPDPWGFESLLVTLGDNPYMEFQIFVHLCLLVSVVSEAAARVKH